METYINLKNIKNVSLFGLLFFFILNLNSQESKEFNLYKKLYPNSSVVRLNQETKITIKVNEDQLDIKQEFIEEDLYLNEGANYNSKKSLHFSTFFELEQVEASSFLYKNGKYQEIKVREFKEKDEIDESFYDDNKSLNFILPSLKKGSKSFVKYTENVTNPRFISPFYFGDFAPIINNKLTIVTDKTVNLSFKEFNTDTLNIIFKKEEKRNNIIYSWEIKNIDEYEYEPNSPTYKKVLPHVVPIITSFKSNNTNVNLANKVDDLYGWYYSLVKGINKEKVDENLVNLVNDLTAGKNSDFEKVKAIYYWVQKNIKYIAFEYALGGFIPRQANDVYQKKYGDCKDNSSILHKMLEIANIKGNLTWIGTRSIPYSYNEVPTPIVDNHMILAYLENDNVYFLDATGRYIPIEYPTPFIQGKQALIADGESNYIIKKVPVVPSKKNAVVENSVIELNEGNLIGTSKIEISGFRKMDCFNTLESETTDDEIKSYYNSIFQKGNNKFLIDSFQEKNKFNYDENLIVDYKFNIKNYAKKLGDEIYINLNLNKDISNYKTEEDRKNDVEYEYKSFFSYTTTLKIPEGYTVEYLPDNVEFSNDFISSSIHYTANNNNTISYKHNINLDFLCLTLDEQKKVNTLIKNIEKAYKEVIILKKN